MSEKGPKLVKIQSVSLIIIINDYYGAGQKDQYNDYYVIQENIPVRVHFTKKDVKCFINHDIALINMIKIMIDQSKYSLFFGMHEVQMLLERMISPL